MHIYFITTIAAILGQAIAAPTATTPTSLEGLSTRQDYMREKCARRKGMETCQEGLYERWACGADGTPVFIEHCPSGPCIESGPGTLCVPCSMEHRCE